VYREGIYLSYIEILIVGIIASWGGIFMTREILVVDDQPGIRLLLEEVLTSQGYQVTCASTGKEGLEKSTRASFDLIILDYKLPIIDGKEVLARLEEKRIATSVILMSGMTENIQTEVKEIKLIREIIAKPFNIKDLCNLLEEIFT